MLLLLRWCHYAPRVLGVNPLLKSKFKSAQETSQYVYAPI